MKLLFTIFLSFCVLTISAQTFEGLKQLSTQDAIQNVQNAIDAADLVIEGIITESSFDTDTRTFHTTYKVTQTFKGELIEDEVSTNVTEAEVKKALIARYGALVSNRQLRPSKAKVGSSGVFFFKNNDGVLTSYSSQLSISYSADCGSEFKECNYGKSFASVSMNTRNGTTTKSFDSPRDFYSFMTKDIQTNLEEESNQTFKKKEKPVGSSDPQSKSTTDAEIISFSPSSLAAGVGDILTIEGEDFGIIRGTVEFQSTCPNLTRTGSVIFDIYDMSNDGGLISWTDNKIEVRVPSSSFE